MTKYIVTAVLLLATSHAFASGIVGLGQGVQAITHGVATTTYGSTGGGGYQSISGTTGSAGRFSSSPVNGGATQNGDAGHH